MDIEKWIRAIPQILEFFVPGYITVVVFKKLQGNDDENKSHESIQIAACVCISYILSILFVWIGSLYVRLLCESITGCLLSFILIKLLGTNRIRHYYSLINHTLIEKTVFESVGLHKNPWVTVFLNDSSMVYGRVVTYGENNDTWIAIDNYHTYGIVFDKEDGSKRDERAVEPQIKDETHVIIVKYDEIRAIVKHAE